MEWYNITGKSLVKCWPLSCWQVAGAAEKGGGNRVVWSSGAGGDRGRIPMGFGGSVDIFQAQMMDLMASLEYV
jgi:hypothetical protein